MNINENNEVNMELQRGLARADFARFLAASFYQPDVMFAEEKMFESMHSVALCISSELAALTKDLDSSFMTNSLEELLVDYTKLFIGPSEIFARPYESVWIKEGNGFLMQESTELLTAIYKKSGFEISADIYAPPDHVAIELEFLYLLLFQKVQNYAQNDADGTNNILELYEQFLNQHLGRWFFAFSLFLLENAQTLFYRNLAKVSSAFIQLELSRSSKCSCH